MGGSLPSVRGSPSLGTVAVEEHALRTHLRPVPTAAFAVLAVAASLILAAPASGQDAPACEPGGDPVTEERHFGPEEAETYELVAFDVAPSTTRVEVTYDWGDDGVTPGTPLATTTVDLGIRDQDGPMSWEGFRGWSGSRHRDVFVQADGATRGYLPGPVEPGVWHAEMGIAAVHPEGGWYRVEMRCLDPAVGDPPTGTPPDPDPVDPDHVADPEAGWYHGDFHMHGYHSHPEGPTWEEFVAFAREQQLDLLPITEYVTTAHWYELGAVQRADPDLLFWPSREIITYDGHAIGLGETWGHAEYRHGFRDVTMADIQEGVKARDALFQVAHPTTFEGEVFGSFCRGCAWEIEDVDWDRVDTIEVQTGPAVARPNSDPRAPGVENPFMPEAIDMWEQLLLEGHRITAVGGSDDKLSGGGSSEYGAYAPHGVPAVAIRAEELSRDAIVEAIRAGRAYLRTRGVADSPALELSATGPDGTVGTFGSTFAADEVEVTLTVTGGQGQVVVLSRNGEDRTIVPVSADPFEHTFTATRAPDEEGPLGTFWRVDTRDHEAFTTVANPIFLTDPSGGGGGRDDDGGPRDGADPGGPGRDGAEGRPTPATGGGAALAGLGLLGGGMLALRRSRLA